MKVIQHEYFTPEKEGVEISTTKKSASIFFHNLELNAQNSISPEVKIVVDKQPLAVVEGKSVCNYAVLIDRETEKMQSLAVQAEALLELAEIERPVKVLEILRSNMHYAYSDVVENLFKSEPELEKWVAENTGLNASHVSDVPLSQLVEKGYGVCRHLSAAYLWLC